MLLTPNYRLRRKFALTYPHVRRCRAPGCGRTFKNASGLTQHVNAHHPGFIPERSSSPSDPMQQEDSAVEQAVSFICFSDSEDVDPDALDRSFEAMSAASGASERNEDESSDIEPEEAASPSSHSRRATVEEVEDEDASMGSDSSYRTNSKTTKIYHSLLNGN